LKIRSGFVSNSSSSSFCIVLAEADYLDAISKHATEFEEIPVPEAEELCGVKLVKVEGLKGDYGFVNDVELGYEATGAIIDILRSYPHIYSTQ
jgi:hypothetical protein